MTGLVVVNYNDYKNTISFIDSIKDYSVIKHIVIVDNCSTDNSYSKLESICDKKVSLIKNTSNKGYGSGINLGSKYLMDNYNVKNIIVSNTDIIINSEEDLVNMISYLKDDVALVGPNVLENGGVNRGWKVPSVWDDVLLNLPVIHRKICKKLVLYSDDYYSSDSSFVEAVSGCFFIVRGDALKKVDYFDENMFLYYEENVLAVKLKNFNYKALIVNGVNVIHNHSVTIDNSLGRVKKYKALKRSQRYFHSNYSKKSIIGMIFLYITYGIMVFFLYIAVFFHKIIKKR